MFYSIIIYASTFALSLMGVHLYQKNIDSYGYRHVSMRTLINRFVWILLLMLPPLLIAAFRDVNVGTDYQSYYRIFNTIKRYNLRQYIQYRKYAGHSVEYGYQIICHLVYRMGGSFIWVNFISEFLIILFVWRGMLYFHKTYGISMTYGMFLFYMLQYPYGLNGVRFSIAVAVFFYATKYLLEKKPLQYFGVCLLAVMFHTTLSITFLFYFINFFNNKIMRRWAKVVIVIGLFLIIYNLGDLLRFAESLSFLKKYFETDVYSISENVSYGLGIWIFIILQYFLLVLFWDLIRQNSGKMQIMLILALLYIPFRFLGYYNEWIARFTRIADLCWCAVIPYLIMIIKQKNNRKLVFSYFTVYAISYYLFNYAILNYSETYPFSWIEL